MGTLIDPSFSVVLTDVIPRLMKFGFWVKTALLPKFIPQLNLTLTLESSANLQPTTVLRMGLRPLSSAKSINRSFEFLGVPDTLRTNGTYWIDNILVTSPYQGVGGTVTNLNWRSQPGGCYDIVYVPRHGAVPARTNYLPRSPENSRATARRFYDNLLRENRLACVQSLSNSRHILIDCLVNRTDFA